MVMDKTRAQRERLKGFLDSMLVSLGRSERRQWGGVYVRGLLATGGRKATASMAAHVSDGNVQAMQQFISQSPWHWDPLRKGLAHRLIETLHPVAAWVVDDTGFPKKVSHSVGVTRQYSGTLGKIGNCQVAVSLHYATDDAAVPLDFALYLPEEWLEEERRQKAGIPQDVTFQPKWALALALIDRALALGGTPGRGQRRRGLWQHHGVSDGPGSTPVALRGGNPEHNRGLGRFEQSGDSVPGMP